MAGLFAFLGGNREAAQVFGADVVPPTRSLPPQPHVPAVIVPYDAGTDPLASKRIFISNTELLRLQKLAKPDLAVDLSAPDGAIVSAARYTAEFQLQMGKPVIAVRGELAIHSFRDAPVTVKLPLGQVALQSVTLDGRPAPVTFATTGLPIVPDPVAVTNAMPRRGSTEDVRQTAPTPATANVNPSQQVPQAAGANRGFLPPPRGYQLVIEKRGLHRVELAFSIPAGSSVAAAGEFSIPLQPVAAGRLTFELPVSGSNVRVNGSSGAFRRVAIESKQRIEIPVDKGGTVAVRWEPATGGPASGSDVIHAESAGQGMIADAGGFFSSNWTFRVFQGGMSEMTFNLPEEVRVRSISGPDVAGWELATSNEQPTLKVFFRQRITTTTQVAIELYRPLEISDEEPTELVYPTPAPQNVVRAAGTIAIHAPSHLRVDANAKSGAVRIPAEQATPLTGTNLTAASGAIQSAFRFVSGSPEIDLKIVRKKAETTARSEHALFLTPQATNSASRITFELKGLPRSRLAVQIPEDYQIATVEAGGLADWHLSSDRATLYVNLAAPRLGDVPVLISGRSPRKLDAANVELILPLPMDVTAMSNLAAVWFDEEFVATSPPQMGWRPVAVGDLSAELRNRRKTPPQFAFRTADPEPNLLTFPMTRGTVRLSGDTVTQLNVSDSALRARVALRWTIAGGRTDRFVFTTPESLKGKLEFPSAGIRSIVTDKAPNNRTRWTILTSRPREGVFLLGGTALLPLPATELSAPSFVLESPTGNGETLTYSPLETQRSFVILTNHSSLQLVAVKPAELRKVTADLLPIRLQPRTIAAAAEILRLKDATSVPNWTLRRFTRQATAAATVHSAELITVLNLDGTWKTAAEYRIKNRTRQFLALRIPEGSSLLSVFVDGAPARAVQSKIENELLSLIPLPRTSEVDLSFPVHVVLGGRLASGALPQGVRLRAEELDLPAPHVVSDRNHPFSIPVSQTRWRVHVPEKLDVTPIDDPKRNNMTAVDEENGMFSAADRVKEAADLLSRVTSAPESMSLKQKQQALANARILKEELLSDSSSKPEDSKSYGGLPGPGLDKKKSKGKADATQGRTRDELQRLERETARLETQINESKQLSELRDGANVTGAEPESAATPWYFELSQGGSEQTESGDDPLATLRFSLPATELAKNQSRQSTSGEQPQTRQMYQQQGELNALNQSLDANFARQQPGKKSGVPVLNRLPYVSRLGDRTQSGMSAAQPSSPLGRTQSVGPNVGYIVPADLSGTVSGKWEGVPPVRSGKLSLALEIPTQGRVLEFNKVGGEPMLVLAVRPNESWQWGARILWTLVWIAFAITLIVAIRRARNRALLVRMVATAALVVGILLYFALPGMAAVSALVLSIVGAIVLAIARSRHQSISILS